MLSKIIRKSGNIDMLHEGVWHSCAFTDHPFAKVEISTILTESRKAPGSLLVRNQYKFIFNSSREHSSGDGGFSIENDNDDDNDSGTSNQTLISWLASSHPQSKRTRIWFEKFFNKEAG